MYRRDEITLPKKNFYFHFFETASSRGSSKSTLLKASKILPKQVQGAFIVPIIFIIFFKRAFKKKIYLLL